MNNRDIKETIACSIAQCNGACLVYKKKHTHTTYTHKHIHTHHIHTHHTPHTHKPTESHTHTHTHTTHTHTYQENWLMIFSWNCLFLVLYEGYPWYRTVLVHLCERVVVTFFL